MAALTLPCGHENGTLLKQHEKKFNIGKIFKAISMTNYMTMIIRNKGTTEYIKCK